MTTKELKQLINFGANNATIEEGLCNVTYPKKIQKTLDAIQNVWSSKMNYGDEGREEIIEAWRSLRNEAFYNLVEKKGIQKYEHLFTTKK